VKLSDLTSFQDEAHSLSDWLALLSQADPGELQQYYDNNVPPELQRRIISPVYKKVPIPDALRWQVFQRDNFTCQKCGAREFLSADHIVSERKGGPTTLENLQTLCGPCNSRKGSK
jgi:5-methylcytosine-specific restriction endonuclease McrA